MASSGRRGRVALGYLDGSIDILDGSSGQQLSQIRSARTSAVEQIRFSPDGFLLASFGGDGHVQLHNTEHGQLTYRCPISDESQRNGLAVNDLGRLIAYRQFGEALVRFDLSEPEDEDVIVL